MQIQQLQTPVAQCWGRAASSFYGVGAVQWVVGLQSKMVLWAEQGTRL